MYLLSESVHGTTHTSQIQHPPPTTTPQIQQRKHIQSPTPPPPPSLVAQNVVQPPPQLPQTLKTESPNPPPSPTVSAKMTQQQTQQDNEQFALAWLRATFEPVTTMATRIEHQDMYKMYLTASSKIGRVGVASPQHFPRCVRLVFGAAVGPNIPKCAVQSDSPTLFYEGIRIRSKPLAVVYKGTILVSILLTIWGLTY